jgi:hypothetical protein
VFIGVSNLIKEAIGMSTKHGRALGVGIVVLIGLIVTLVLFGRYNTHELVQIPENPTIGLPELPLNQTATSVVQSVESTYVPEPTPTSDAARIQLEQNLNEIVLPDGVQMQVVVTGYSGQIASATFVAPSNGWNIQAYNNNPGKNDLVLFKPEETRKAALLNVPVSYPDAGFIFWVDESISANDFRESLEEALVDQGYTVTWK